MLFVGFAFYATAMVLGLGAHMGLRFGVWHHLLYAVVLVTTIASLVLAFHLALLVTLAALLCFPNARPRTPWHPSLAVVGLLGYGLALLDPSLP